MEDIRIENLVWDVFRKAERETVSHTRFALATHVASKTNLSSKTLERAYDKYVTRTNKGYKLQADSIDLLCTYLGYNDFAHYVKEKSQENNSLGTTTPQTTRRNPLFIMAGGGDSHYVHYISMARQGRKKYHQCKLYDMGRHPLCPNILRCRTLINTWDPNRTYRSH